MEKTKNIIAFIGVGITIGLVISIIFQGVIRATPTKVTVWGVEYEIPTSTMIPTQEPTNIPFTIIPSSTYSAQIQPTNTQSFVLQPKNLPKPSQSPDLIQGVPVSPESLASSVGGEAAFWKKAGPVIWVYSNKNHNTTIRHPGENMVLTYWGGFGDPQNASDCQIIISPANNLEKAVKCPSGTNAQLIADQVGLHIVDFTGFFTEK